AEGIDLPTSAPVPGFDLAPPQPLQQYMGIGQWLLRDVNWWGDFRATSKQAADFWEILHSERVDGVVAINEAVIESLLDSVGPVTMSDGAEVRGKNVKEATLARVFAGKNPSDWYAAQSDFSQELAQKLVLAALRLPLERQPALIQRLQESAHRRDL